MTSLLRWSAAMLVWGAVLWGVLQIQHLPVAENHSICGVWGCGPPPRVLITCHAAWLVILAPAGLLLPGWLSSSHLRITGWVLLAAGTVGLIAVVIHDAVTWLPRASQFLRGYFGHKVLFSLVTLTDVPIVEGSLLGVVYVVVSRVRGGELWEKGSPNLNGCEQSVGPQLVGRRNRNLPLCVVCQEVASTLASRGRQPPDCWSFDRSPREARGD